MRAKTTGSIRIPPAWASHSCCLMGWSFQSGWSRHAAKKVKAELSNVIQTIARYEPVRVLAAPGHDAREANREFGCVRNIEVIEHPVSTIWLRDEAPMFALSGAYKYPDLIAIDWRFNGWGGSDPAYKDTGAFSEDVLRRWGAERMLASFVAEGGALLTDGQGTVITTRSCLLNPNRNPVEPRVDRQLRIERALREFGIRNVVWLEGDPCEPITSGHVDGYVMAAPDGIILVEQPDGSHTDISMWREHDIELLHQATDVDGRSFKIVPVLPPRQRYLRKTSPLFAPAYLNAYVANGAVIMASFGDSERDESAQEAVRRSFPGRKVEAIAIDHIAEGGGGVHCLTQPIPSI